MNLTNQRVIYVTLRFQVEIWKDTRERLNMRRIVECLLEIIILKIIKKTGQDVTNVDVSDLIEFQIDDYFPELKGIIHLLVLKWIFE